tara:strand:- start:176 stop:499 length:324 start_codon:yes stop_codon:yes gene_type:complete
VPDKTGENRNFNGTFKKGVSGNLNGRPQGSQSIPDILKKIGFEEGTKDGSTSKLEVVLRKVFHYALQGKSWAVEFIANRTEGKAVERTADVTDKWHEIVRSAHSETE